LHTGHTLREHKVICVLIGGSLKLNKHTVYDRETGKCKPAHEFKTCEICNIYWSKYYDKFHIESWLESYHNQAQDLLKKQDNLFIEVNDG